MQELNCFGSYEDCDKCYCCILNKDCLSHKNVLAISAFVADEELLRDIESAKLKFLASLSESELNSLRSIHRKKKCPICSEKFDGYSELAKHLKNH
ncbi:MAG: hypothetical protein QXJ68_05890 [Methanocellales archaeon]